MSRLLSTVHTNSDNTLSVIANLVQKRFCVDTYYGCLHNQFLYTMESLTGIKASRLWIRKEDNQQHLPLNMMGITPSKLIATYSPHTKLREFNLFYQGYRGLNDAIEDVLNGQPVVMVISSENPAWEMSNRLHYYERPSQREPGEVTVFDGNVYEYPKESGYHALLLIGYDRGGDFLIFRDSKDDYSYKGYLRIKRRLVERKKKSAVFFSFGLSKKL